MNHWSRRALLTFGWSLLLGSLTLHAQTQMPGMAFGPIGRMPFGESSLWRLETKNDSFSLLSREDWDDLRTFGLYAGFSNRTWAIELDVDSLTDRSNHPETGQRIDLINATVTGSLARLRGATGSIYFLSGAGVLWTGDLQLARLQKIVHRINEVDRPFPETYEHDGTLPILTADILAHGNLNTPLGQLFFHSSLEASPSGFVRTAHWLEFPVFSGTPGFSVSAGYQWAGGYKSSGRTLAATVQSETGFQTGVVFALGLLETGFGYNLQTRRQSGYAAITLGGSKLDDQSRYKGKGVQGIDIQVWPIMAAARARRSLYVRAGKHPLALSPVLGFESGPIQYSLTGNHLSRSYSNELYRYEQAYSGLDASIEILSFLDFFVMGAGGIRREQLNTSTVIASQSLKEETAWVCLAETGARLYFPDKKPGRSNWGAGVSLTVLYSSALETGVRTYAKGFITSAIGR